MADILHREWVYIWCYFTVQFEQIFRYWVLGMLIGSAVSVFAKDGIHRAFSALRGRRIGILVRLVCKDKPFFDFEGFKEPVSRDTDPNMAVRYIKNLGRNIRITGGYFLAGIFLSALFQRYVPAEAMTALFGGNEALGVLMAATIGVPLYACGGGTIPILQQWLAEGMSMGSGAAFMITGPATKITNLGALKIVLGLRRFLTYIGFVMLFSLITGLAVNMLF